MTDRTRVVILMGFTSLVILIGFLGFSMFTKAEAIQREVSAIHEAYHDGISRLNNIQSDIYYSGILVRDYLLDPVAISGLQYRSELVGLRASTEKHVHSLADGAGHEDSGTLDRLRRGLAEYWESLDPVFDWSAQQKAAFSVSFLRKVVIPRRQALLSITREIDDLNRAGFTREQQRLEASRRGYRSHLARLFAAVILLAGVVGVFGLWRISGLEKQSKRERKRVETAERELRRLSQKLVQAQEQERKLIARELHDEIGQMITALRIELGNLALLRTGSADEFARHLAEAKTLSEKTLHSVRNLAMGLRPSMLDDLGLGPALQWQAKEFSRRSGIAVTVDIDGDLPDLADPIRTCVYRVVQESLTNCARHAHARNIRVALTRSEDVLSLTIEDDGVGFDPEISLTRGLGLVGMAERVRELDGIIQVSSRPQKGSVVDVSIPLAKEMVS